MSSHFRHRLKRQVQHTFFEADHEQTSSPIERFLTILGMREPRQIWARRFVRYIWAPLVALFLCSVTGLSIAAFVITEFNRDPNDNNRAYLSYIFFSLIVPTQYWLGWRYYRQNHLYNLLSDCRRAHLQGLPNQWGMIGGILGMTISLLTINLCLWGFLGPPPQFHLLGMSSESALVMLIIYWIWAWLIVSTNMVVFCTVFSKHLKDLRQLLDFMENKLIWEWDRCTINDLARWMVNLKYGVNSSIDRLESFYTVATIIGAIGLGPMVEFKNFKWDAYLIYYVVSYAMMQVVFMITIYVLTKVKGDIYKLVKSPMIMSRYLSQIKDLNGLEVHRLMDLQADEQQITEAKIHSHCTSRHSRKTNVNKCSLGLMVGPPGTLPIDDEVPSVVQPARKSPIRNRKITDQSNDVETTRLVDVDVDLEQGEGESGENESGENESGENESRERESGENESREHESGETRETVPEENVDQKDSHENCVDAELQSIQARYRTMAGVDWLILEKILAERWADFSLLGVQFGGTDVIKKGMGLTALLVMAVSYVNSITFSSWGLN